MLLSETLSQNGSKQRKENPNLENSADFTFKKLVVFVIFNILIYLCFTIVIIFITYCHFQDIFFF